MKVLVVGSKSWSNYSEVMRQMTVFLEDLAHEEDNTVTFVHAGNMGAENMVTEYIGKVEKFLRQKGYHIKEQVFRNSYKNNKSINDYEMIQSGADFGIIFATRDCKRSSYCEKIMREFEIPVKIING